MDIGLDRRLGVWKCETMKVRVAPVTFHPRERGENVDDDYSVCRSAARPRVGECGCRGSVQESERRQRLTASRELGTRAHSPFATA